MLYNILKTIGKTMKKQIPRVTIESLISLAYIIRKLEKQISCFDTGIAVSKEPHLSHIEDIKDELDLICKDLPEAHDNAMNVSDYYSKSCACQTCIKVILGTIQTTFQAQLCEIAGANIEITDIKTDQNDHHETS